MTSALVASNVAIYSGSLVRGSGHKTWSLVEFDANDGFIAGCNRLVPNHATPVFANTEILGQHRPGWLN